MLCQLEEPPAPRPSLLHILGKEQGHHPTPKLLSLEQLCFVGFPKSPQTSVPGAALLLGFPKPLSNLSHLQTSVPGAALFDEVPKITSKSQSPPNFCPWSSSALWGSQNHPKPLSLESLYPTGFPKLPQTFVPGADLHCGVPKITPKPQSPPNLCLWGSSALWGSQSHPKSLSLGQLCSAGFPKSSPKQNHPQTSVPGTALICGIPKIPLFQLLCAPRFLPGVWRRGGSKTQVTPGTWVRPEWVLGSSELNPKPSTHRGWKPACPWTKFHPLLRNPPPLLPKLL